MPDVNQDLDSLFTKAASQYGLPVNFLKAIAQQESGFKPDAVSSQGAQGIMQMLPDTARAMGAKDPFDPTQAIPAAARYLREGYDATGSLQGAAAYYHGGPDTKQWGPKTRAYVQSIGGILSKFDTEPSAAGGSATPTTYASLPAQAGALSDAGIQPLPTSQKAAPAASAQGNSQSDDDLLKLYAKPGALPDASASAASAPAKQTLSDDDLLKLYARPDAPAAVPPPVVAQPQGQPGALANAPDDSALTAAGKLAATGAVKGVSDAVGAVGNTKGLADYLLARVESATSGKPLSQVMAQQQANQQAIDSSPTLPGRIAAAINPMNYLPNGQQVANKLLSATGEYVPQSETGRMAQAGIQTAVGSLGPGARGVGGTAPAGVLPTAPVANMLTNAASAAPITAASGAVGQYATDATGDPLVGLAASLAPGAAVQAAGGATNKLLGTMDPRSAALAQAASDRGIKLGIGQMSSNPTVRMLDSVVNKIPGSGGAAVKEGQAAAFNRSVAQTFGENAERITPEVMANARDRIGQAFDSVAARTPTIPADPQFVNSLKQTLSDAGSVLPANEVEPLTNQVRNIISAIDPNSGAFSGQTYQALTRKGAPLDRALSSPDPNIRHYAGQIRDALDDAMQRAAPTDAAADLQQARSQWRNMRTVEDLVAKAPEGNISPALLQGRVNANNKGTYGAAYGGGGDLKELANIGQRFLKEPGSSNTAERSMLINMLTGMGGAGTSLMTGQAPLTTLGSAVALPLATSIAARGTNALLQNNALAQALIARGLGQQQPGVGNLLLNASLPALNRGGNVPVRP